MNKKTEFNWVIYYPDTRRVVAGFDNEGDAVWFFNAMTELWPTRVLASRLDYNAGLIRETDNTSNDDFHEKLRDRVLARIMEWRLFEGHVAQNTSRYELLDEIVSDVEWEIEQARSSGVADTVKVVK